MSQRWHPWRHAAEHYPDVVINCRRELPDRVWGITSFSLRKVWICRRLRQVHRRCTLTHELIHLERGPVPSDPVQLAKEERIVDELAARRLIELPDLIDGLKWTQDLAELADALWVDMPTLRTRMSTLGPLETAELEHELGDEWLWIP
ncbi:hypothetical protein A5755_04500 [Mycolicibacterium fortuitum]|nr:hypothetical protein A5754_29355 [Mycolicibacterium fortuitum]OBB51591.1 hypothetical protein A5755_04500 [Mycolicibacterium fortuitum]OBF77412.1 hypothetical protein A5751_22470 [Mycolicibacterium fortuitum]